MANAPLGDSIKIQVISSTTFVTPQLSLAPANGICPDDVGAVKVDIGVSAFAGSSSVRRRVTTQLPVTQLPMFRSLFVQVFGLSFRFLLNDSATDFIRVAEKIEIPRLLFLRR